jgi:hypothetical protein
MGALDDSFTSACMVSLRSYCIRMFVAVVTEWCWPSGQSASGMPWYQQHQRREQVTLKGMCGHDPILVPSALCIPSLISLPLDLHSLGPSSINPHTQPLDICSTKHNSVRLPFIIDTSQVSKDEGATRSCCCSAGGNGRLCSKHNGESIDLLLDGDIQQLSQLVDGKHDHGDKWHHCHILPGVCNDVGDDFSTWLHDCIYDDLPVVVPDRAGARNTYDHRKLLRADAYLDTWSEPYPARVHCHGEAMLRLWRINISRHHHRALRLSG